MDTRFGKADLHVPVQWTASKRHVPKQWTGRSQPNPKRWTLLARQPFLLKPRTADIPYQGRISAKPQTVDILVSVHIWYNSAQTCRDRKEECYDQKIIQHRRTCRTPCQSVCRQYHLRKDQLHAGIQAGSVPAAHGRQVHAHHIRGAWDCS